MKCFTIMLAAALGGIASAQAADLSSPVTKAQSYYPQSTNWTGFYVGLQLGGGFLHASWTDPFSGLSDSPSSSNVLGGGQIGVNYQFGSWVLGLNADIDGTDLHGSATDAAGFAHTTTSHWLSTVTGRLGYAVERVLFYVKGGAAFADDRDQVVTPGGFTATGSDSTRVGWTAGGGFEYAITNNWSALVEYDYLGFGSDNATLTISPLSSFGTSTANVNLDIQKVIAGVNYRF